MLFARGLPLKIHAMNLLRSSLLVALLLSAYGQGQPLRPPQAAIAEPSTAAPDTPLIFRNSAGEDEELPTVADTVTRLRNEIRSIASSTASLADKQTQLQRMIDDNAQVLLRLSQGRTEFNPQTVDEAAQLLEAMFFEIALELTTDEASRRAFLSDVPPGVGLDSLQPILIAPRQHRSNIVVTLDAKEQQPWWRDARVDTEALALEEIEESPETPPRKVKEEGVEETVAVEFLTQNEAVTVEMHDDTTVLRDVESDDGDLVLFDALHVWVGGGFQGDAYDMDGTFTASSGGGSKNDTYIRRGEVIVRSTLYDWGEFKWQYDLDSNIWRDLYWRKVDADNNRTLTVGNQKEPMGLDFLMGNKFGTAMERSAPSNTFGSFRGTGIRLNNWFDRAPEDQFVRFGDESTAYITTTVGLFTQDIEDTTETDYALTGRTTTGKLVGDRGMHFGASASVRDGSFRRIAPRPEAQDAGRLVLASLHADQQTVGALEGIATRGPLHAQAEFYYSDYRGGDIDGYGYGGYAMVGYFLTGETREYRPKWGLWAPLPHSAKSVFEVFARVSHTYGESDLDNGNYLTNITVGGSWYLRRLRTSINAVYSQVDKDIKGEDNGLAITTRLQYLF